MLPNWTYTTISNVLIKIYQSRNKKQCFCQENINLATISNVLVNEKVNHATIVNVPKNEVYDIGIEILLLQ